MNGHVKLIKASINTATKIKLATFEAVYPFIIHAEVLTHRAFSRNAQSKRAMPVVTFIKHNMFVPDVFTKNCPGMQAKDVLGAEANAKAQELWKAGGTTMAKLAQELSDLGVHKEYANRVFEPFSYMTTLITATDFANFFALRNHTDAHPEIRTVAARMQELYNAATFEEVKPGGWHVPYENMEIEDEELRRQAAVGCCARVSYLTHDGKRDAQKDIDLCNRLKNSVPIHASPFEHIAKALPYSLRVGNFRGWEQYRKTVPNECIND